MLAELAELVAAVNHSIRPGFKKRIVGTHVIPSYASTANSASSASRTHPCRRKRGHQLADFEQDFVRA